MDGLWLRSSLVVKRWDLNKVFTVFFFLYCCAILRIMEIKPNFIIICEKAFLTAGTNNLNLIGIFTQINTDVFPAKYPHFALVTNFDIETVGDHVLEAKIVDPNGTPVAQAQMPIKITASPFQIITNFENLSFPAPGLYSLELSVDGNSVGSRILQVVPVLNQKTNFA